MVNISLSYLIIFIFTTSNKIKTMKRIMPWAIIVLFFISLVSSCGSSKAHCDAYSDVDATQTQQNDLAQR